MTKTKVAILSISALTIILNGAIVPIFSILAAELPGATPDALKLTLSVSSITCVVFSLLTGFLDQYIPKKIMLTFGLVLYAFGGVGGGLVNSMNALLITRAVIGMGAGICLPLATAFITDFYDGEERKQTIGYTRFVASLSNVVLPIIGTTLAERNWRLGFAAYGISLLVLLLVWLFIPNQPKKNHESGEQKRLLYLSGPVLLIAFLYFFTMVLFVSLPGNISLYYQQEGIGNPSLITWVGAGTALISMSISLRFARIHNRLKNWMLPIGFMGLGLGFAVLSMLSTLWSTILGSALITSSLALMHPLFPYMATRDTPREDSTGALAVTSAGFRLGTFVSPFFYRLANRAVGVTTIQGEFLLAAIVIETVALTTAFFFARRQTNPAQ